MVTVEQFSLFERLFKYYNKALFQNQLKDCLINMSRKKGAAGLFEPEMWISSQKEHYHEINISPQCLEMESIEWHGVFVHNMVHLWQYDFGKPSRKGYHNKEWAQKMEEIGLIPSSTGKPSVKRTGQKVSQYHNPVGLFINAFNKLQKKESWYKPLPVLGSEDSGGKQFRTKFRCPFCGQNAWGKPTLFVICGKCGKKLEPQNSTARRQKGG